MVCFHFQYTQGVHLDPSAVFTRGIARAADTTDTAVALTQRKHGADFPPESRFSFLGVLIIVAGEVR